MEPRKKHAPKDDTGLDRVTRAETVARYRKLLGAAIDISERRAIMRQLAEEATKLRNS